MARRFLSSRIALAVVVSGGASLAVLPLPAAAKEKPAAGPKVSFSPAFSKVAAELDKTLADGRANPAVTAASAKAQSAQTPADKQAAAAEVDAALGGIKAKLDASASAVSTPGDKLKHGDMIRTYGVFIADPATQHAGLVEMLDSGGLDPAALSQVQFLAGITAYQINDYAGAIPYLKSSYDAGYRDSQGYIGKVLADSYRKTNNNAAALDLVQKDLANARAAGTKPSDETIRTALQAAYDAKDMAQSSDLSAELVRNYPSSDSWATAIGVVRSLGNYPADTGVDLMRLMFRANAMKDKRDYFEYLQDVDPRKQPGESLKVINQGVAAGKISAADVADFKSTANARLTADKASLPSLEADARKPGTSAMLTIASADAFLGYDQSAKAAEIYQLALAKPGVDTNLAKLRIGIALVDAGKYADAKTAFGQITGPRAPIAKLWSAYADTKLAPAAPPTAPAA